MDRGLIGSGFPDALEWSQGWAGVGAGAGVLAAPVAASSMAAVLFCGPADRALWREVSGPAFPRFSYVMNGTSFPGSGRSEAFSGSKVPACRACERSPRPVRPPQRAGGKGPGVFTLA